MNKRKEMAEEIIEEIREINHDGQSAREDRLSVLIKSHSGGGFNFQEDEAGDKATANPEVAVKNKKLISLDAAGDLIKQGWKAADLHVHTFYSYDVVPTREVDPLVLFERARARGMSFVCFTDHDTMEAYDRVGWTREGVITGVEVKVLDRRRVGHTVHINIYTLDKRQFKEIEKIARVAGDIEMLVEYLKGENLPFTFNHPFWHEPGEKLNAGAVVELADVFPVLEYNLGRIGKLNRMVLKLATAKDREVVAGTDSHTGDAGRIFTVARGEDFREFFESIKSGEARLVTEDLTYQRIKNEIRNRLEMLMDSRRWVMGKKGLKMETGNVLADAVIATLSGGREREESLAVRRELVKFLARMVSSTGVPARIYLRKQNMLAIRIQEELNLAA